MKIHANFESVLTGLCLLRLHSQFLIEQVKRRVHGRLVVQEWSQGNPGRQNSALSGGAQLQPPWFSAQEQVTRLQCPSSSTSSGRPQ